MAYRALDLALISAQELKNVNLISKLHVYAVVSLSGDMRTRQRTPTDRHGGENPIWNHTFHFLIPADGDSASRLSVHVLLRAERVLGDRDIGETRIPLKDLISSGSSDGTQAAQFVSYQIQKDGSGKPRGLLNISYKLGERLATPPMIQPQEPVIAYPPPMPRYAQPYGAPVGGFGYPPPSYGYGYPQQPPVQQGLRNRNNFGMGLGAGLLGGALGGLLVGDMISDVGAYDAGYDAGVYDAGGWMVDLISRWYHRAIPTVRELVRVNLRMRLAVLLW